MSKYLLDTNICIYILKKKPQNVYNNFIKYDVGEIAISTITFAELQYGVQKSSKIIENQLALNEFIKPFNVIDFDFNSAIVYAEIRAELEKQGKIIGTMDLLISSIAISNNLTLVTNNTKEFERIELLKLQNWV